MLQEEATIDGNALSLLIMHRAVRRIRYVGTHQRLRPILLMFIPALSNKSGDVQLSSVPRILSVLDMVGRKQEGAVLLRKGDEGSFSREWCFFNWSRKERRAGPRFL
jgi:hypothetical protein